MSAFDTAWTLLKMPLDFDSIRDAGTITERDVPYRRFEADFVDPKTQERLLAYAQMSKEGRGIGKIRTPNLSRAFHMIDNYGDKGIYPSTIYTSKQYRKRGYQEALLHLIMRLAEAEGRTFVEPYKSFKTGDGNMFAEKMRDKHDDSNIGVME